MKMFMSQKPSSVDLRVSDFKRIPGFNYVLSVSRRRTTTRTTRCALRSERAKEKTVGDRCRTSRARARAAAAREAKIPAASCRRAVRCGLSGHTPWIRDGSLIAAHEHVMGVMGVMGPAP